MKLNRGQLQAASGPADPNLVVRTFNVKSEINDLPAQLTVVHLVLDFAPGESTPMQIHGGWALHTVLAGDLTLQEKGTQKPLKTGDGWDPGFHTLSPTAGQAMPVFSRRSSYTKARR